MTTSNKDLALIKVSHTETPVMTRSSLETTGPNPAPLMLTDSIRSSETTERTSFLSNPTKDAMETTT